MIQCFLGNHYDGEMMTGMTFTIEPILCTGNPKFFILADKWTAATRDGSRTAQYEHTILITKSGCEILTISDKELIEIQTHLATTEKE